MKNIIRLSAIILITTILWSCEEIITIDLNKVSPKVVIEAFIEEDSVCTAQISFSKSIYDGGETEYINDAIVNLKNSNGESENLVLLANGKYIGNSIIGTPDVTYTITIEVDGISYEAESYLPVAVPIKDILILPQFSHRGTNFVIQCMLDDPANEDNFYKMNYEKLNAIEEQIKGFGIFNDYLSDGKEVTNTLFDFYLQENDSLRIDLLSIDRSTYNYFYQLSDVQSAGMMGSSTPYNPESNFSNGCLGYFGSWSKDTKKVKLKIEAMP